MEIKQGRTFDEKNDDMSEARSPNPNPNPNPTLTLTLNPNFIMKERVIINIAATPYCK